MKFTLKEFFEQVNYLRQLMGEKSFWAKPESERRGAVNGLTFVYSNTKTDTPKDEETLINIFSSTIGEYTRRESMILINQLAPA